MITQRIQQLKELLAGIQNNTASKFDPDKVLEKTMFLMGLDTSDLERDEELPPEEQEQAPGEGVAAPQLNASKQPVRSATFEGRSAGQLAGNAARRLVETI